MVSLDSLLNETYPVDSEYFGVNILSLGIVAPSAGNDGSYTISSVTTQVLPVAGYGAGRGVGEQLKIVAINDTTSQISFQLLFPGIPSGSGQILTTNVYGYDPATNSILTINAPASTLSIFSSTGELSAVNQLGGVFSNDPVAGTTITFTGLGVSTTVVAPVAPTPTPTPTPSGTGSGSGTAALPVYRFFDTNFGTHLFTQSLAEAQQILSSRSDLTQETNNFGAVSQTNPSAEPVYRFFETTNGTHFFTASFDEFNALRTPGTATYRPDLTFEASSTFYEDSVQLYNDVPVYRLFDTAHGTQFLTGSQSEYQGLTTPGSGSYRPDLTPEGIAFYAPAGTSHT